MKTLDEIQKGHVIITGLRIPAIHDVGPDIDQPLRLKFKDTSDGQILSYSSLVIA